MFLINRSKSTRRLLSFKRRGNTRRNSSPTLVKSARIKLSEKKYRLGETTVYVEQGCFEGPNGRFHLQPQLIDVLQVLVANAGEVVSRNSLMETVWAGKVVTEESLTRAISELRKALHDKASTPKFIQTIPKKGYCLICLPEPIDEQPDEASVNTAHSLHSLNILSYWLGGVIVLTGLSVLASLR